MYKITSQPSLPITTIDELRNYLQFSGTDEDLPMTDDYIKQLILSCEQKLSMYTDYHIGEYQYTHFFQEIPCEFEVDKRPFKAINTEYLNEDNIWTPFVDFEYLELENSIKYITNKTQINDINSEKSIIFKINLTVGADIVPADFKTAILIYTTALINDNGLAKDGSLPLEVYNFISRYKRFHY